MGCDVKVPINNAGVLFPFERMREGQRQFYTDCTKAVEQGRTIIAYAPTGIGKTAAALTASIEYAIDRDMKIFFTTSRHSQHIIAVETLKRIAKKHGLDLHVVDIINKKDMCLREDIKNKTRLEFNIECARGRKSKKCPFFRVNRLAANEILNNVMHVDESRNVCMLYLSCPHATVLNAIQLADVIVADYNYIIDAGIRNIILSKTKKDLSDTILIVDEAHSLPERVRSLYTEGLTNGLLASAVKETKEYVRHKLLDTILKSLFALIPDDDETERYVDKDDFVYGVERVVSKRLVQPISYDDILSVLDYGVDRVVNEVEDEFYASAIAGVLNFLISWRREDEHTIRIQNNQGIFIVPMDPSDFTQDIFQQVHASILMSGTLYPPDYYANMLGVFDPMIRIYKSPFPDSNRLVLVDKNVTTLYSKRNNKEFRKIGERISEIASLIPGNVAVFLPSYLMISQILPYITVEKYIVVEDPTWSKAEKSSILSTIENSDNFMFVCVQQGSFSEGIDFKGNSLKGIIIVGLPLDPPTLEKQSLVRYFDAKFGKGKGLEYAYYIPAFNKVLQSSGRGIRSATDRCVIVLMDERYEWPKYKRFFPKRFKPLDTKRISDFINIFYAKWSKSMENANQETQVR